MVKAMPTKTSSDSRRTSRIGRRLIIDESHGGCARTTQQQHFLNRRVAGRKKIKLAQLPHHQGGQDRNAAHQRRGLRMPLSIGIGNVHDGETLAEPSRVQANDQRKCQSDERNDFVRSEEQSEP